jgi:hypothetical protein
MTILDPCFLHFCDIVLRIHAVFEVYRLIHHEQYDDSSVFVMLIILCQSLMLLLR